MAADQSAAKRFRGEGWPEETYEIRYQLPSEAETAVSFDGRELAGQVMSVVLDETSRDMTKVIVSGLPPNVAAADLEGLFSGAGTVLYAGPARKGGRVAKAAPEATAVGEVRFETPEEAQQAVAQLDGSQVRGCTITASLDRTSKDLSKLIITGLPAMVQKQELKDHCMQAGRVAFAGLKNSPGAASFIPGVEAEVRYDDPETTQQAINQLNNSVLGGQRIQVRLDEHSKDRTRILASGIPANVQNRELKDHFKVVGRVAFAGIKGGGAAPMLAAGGGTIPWQGGVGPGAYVTTMFGPAYAPAYTPAPAFAPRYAAPTTAPAMMGSVEAEVRYDDPETTQQAIFRLNNSVLGGQRIQVRLDEHSKDRTRILASGIPANVQNRELKDHFRVIGRVAFAGIKGGGCPQMPMGGCMAPCGGGFGKGAHSGAMMGGYGGFGGCGGYGGFGGGAAVQPSFGKGFAPAAGRRGGGGGKGLSGGIAEVRYDNPGHARAAAATLNGSFLQGTQITVAFDESSKGGNKVMVTGVPVGCGWQEVKDHFASVGRVAFADVRML